MWLLRLEPSGGYSLAEYFGKDIPQYAILSHTWGADHEEVSFKDLKEGTGKEKIGYRKLTFCATRAVNDGLRYFWVDTCCIDQSSSAQLSEAINSMFCWYRNSAKCYAFLSDVTTSGFKNNSRTFQESRWFTRGWTLQELLAPRDVEFFSKEGVRLGDRDSLKNQIAQTSGIPLQALQGVPLSFFSVEERMSWAKRRETKREEDMAYCLLGIFDIHMPLIYGERQEKAEARLLKKIGKAPQDKLAFSARVTPAKGTKKVQAKKFQGKLAADDSWKEVTKSWKQKNRCCNCGSRDHWEQDCQEVCGKCTPLASSPQYMRC